MTGVKAIRWGRILIGLGLIAAGFLWMYLNAVLGVGGSGTSGPSHYKPAITYPHTGVQTAGSLHVGIDWLTSNAQLRQHPATIELVIGIHNTGDHSIAVRPADFKLVPQHRATITAQNTLNGGLVATTLAAHSATRGLLRFVISRNVDLHGGILTYTVPQSAGGAAGNPRQPATLTWSVA